MPYLRFTNNGRLTSIIDHKGQCSYFVFRSASSSITCPCEKSKHEKVQISIQFLDSIQNLIPAILCLLHDTFYLILDTWYLLPYTCILILVRFSSLLILIFQYLLFDEYYSILTNNCNLILVTLCLLHDTCYSKLVVRY